MSDLKALEALIESRLTPEEIAKARAAADRKVARLLLSYQFANSLAARRKANPASMSPVWGTA